MPKRRAGSRKGWYARQRRALEERMRQLTIQETVPLPTAQQIQELLQMACENASNPSPASPTSILISLLLLLNQISSMEASIFWAYVPDPPLLQPVGWEMSSVPVYVNDTILLGGFSDKHIFPQNASISYTGSSSQLPMCFFRNHNVSGCLTVTDVGYSDYSTGWSVDIPGVTKLTGHAQRRNGTGPQDIPFCGLGHKGKHIAVPWKLCRNETATVYSITNDTHSLWDWSPDSERNPGKESNRQFAARIWNLGGTLVYQTEVWKLLAAFETSGSFMQTGEKVKGGLFWNATWRYPRACVPYPFMIIAGSVNLTKNNSQYYIHCFNCTLTNCIQGIRNNSGVLIVKQPPFVMLPVNLTEPWYEESGLELWNKVRTALARPRRGIGLIILGVVTLITLIASAVTASVSLAQSVHTAGIVDDLAKNTSKALGIQEDIDRKLEDRLNALYDAVRFLGEVQGLKLRTKIRCHANYRWICVTPKIYNDTETPWDRVKSHLDGIWHNENISLDLLQLHQEILDIENAPRASMDLAENAEEFVNSLFSNFPSITSLWHLFSGVVAMLLVLALFVCITPCIIKKFVKELWDIKAVLHSNYLRQKNQACHFIK
ncbi:endogenous retrovirus group K member 25 Env polyprotein-like [Cervus elaphus]|uniref:endogenous retrovirus group K member 25 Env polyprotein-like n=1 Tax=Cervus elaphus TaxID=9860 RepID=UPI001CC2B000|nr:endogenous retrovirus group K member 25 Env polyprotein-like [Cervus elaphus]